MNQFCKLKGKWCHYYFLCNTTNVHITIQLIQLIIFSVLSQSGKAGVSWYHTTIARTLLEARPVKRWRLAAVIVISLRSPQLWYIRGSIIQGWGGGINRLVWKEQRWNADWVLGEISKIESVKQPLQKKREQGGISWSDREKGKRVREDKAKPPTLYISSLRFQL